MSSAEGFVLPTMSKGSTSPALDEALERLAAYGPESLLAGSNHAPMVAEVLCTLGREQALGSWLDAYTRRLSVRTARQDRVTPEGWRNALGRMRRYDGWVVRFREELAQAAWPDVLATWVPRLADGVAAGAFHGPIRTAHAVRSLSAKDSAPRREELARALAYWAARHQPLRTQPAAAGARSGLSAGEALRHLRPLPLAGLRRGLPNIVAGVVVANFSKQVRSAAHGLAAIDDPASFLSNTTREAARRMLVNRRGFVAAVAFLHALTGPAASRMLLPWLPIDAQRELALRSWHVVAALCAAFGPTPQRRPSRTREPAPDFEALVDRAVALAASSGDAHAVKIVEACRRESQEGPDPDYALAAEHTLDALAGRAT